jgi:DNA-binding response OmpR family regulator
VSPESRNGQPLVLVADDDPDLLEMVVLLLRRSNYEVVTARDGEEALRVALDRLPDLAVLDVKMPGLDGVDVLRRIRDNETTARMPAILVSAGVEQEKIAAGLAAGANDYVKKPFSPRDLLATVETALATGH